MPLGSVSPFRPTGTVSLSTSNVSANVALRGGGDSVVVINPSNTVTYIAFGADNTVVAAMSDMPILPNSNVILSVNSLITYVAAVVASGGGGIFFSRGDGSII